MASRRSQRRKKIWKHCWNDWELQLQLTIKKEIDNLSRGSLSLFHIENHKLCLWFSIWKETPYRLTRYGVLWTRRESNPRPFGCEPNALPTVSLLCTPYAPWEKENRRIFVHIKCPASPMDFLGRKYGFQSADFQKEAIWDVIWLADKWATGPWDVTHLGFRCIASQFTIKYDVP